MMSTFTVHVKFTEKNSIYAARLSNFHNVPSNEYLYSHETTAIILLHNV